MNKNYAPVMISALYAGHEYDENFDRKITSPFMIQALYHYTDKDNNK